VDFSSYQYSSSFISYVFNLTHNITLGTKNVTIVVRALFSEKPKSISTGGIRFYGFSTSHVNSKTATRITVAQSFLFDARCVVIFWIPQPLVDFHKEDVRTKISPRQMVTFLQ